MVKPKVATANLTGCFGCHMSLLDIDERILELVKIVDFDKSPIDDIKEFSGPVDIGLIEELPGPVIEHNAEVKMGTNAIWRAPVVIPLVAQ